MSADIWPRFRSLSFPRLAADIGIAVIAAGVHMVHSTYEALVYQFDPHRPYR